MAARLLFRQRRAPGSSEARLDTMRCHGLRPLPRRLGDEVMKDNLPPIELLEATHTFPGPYTVKAIGNRNDLFAAQIVAAARSALELETDPQFSCRESSGGKHIAVTLQLLVRNAREVH